MCEKKGNKGMKEININGVKIKYDIKGVSIIDKSLSLLSFIILVDIIAGTEHPKSNYKWN